MSDDERAVALLGALDDVVAVDGKEAADLAATRAAIARLADPFCEHAQLEHVTTGAFVVSSLGVVLHRHKHLGIWVLPGGHVDDGEQVVDAAVREVLEETGVTAVHLDAPLLVNVDVHMGPRDHLHYDCRFLLVATTTQLCPGEDESPEVGWFLPEAAMRRCADDLRAGLAKALGCARALGLDAVASWPT